VSTRVQTWCAWCGPAFALVFFAGMLLAGLLPPPSPGRSAQEVAAFYRDDTDLIRLGLFIMMIAAGLTAPFGAVISAQLRRVPGSSAMVYMQLVGAATGVLAIIVPVLLFTAAAFRPERSPELTQLVDDAAWLPFIMNFPPAILQAVAIGVVVLALQRDTVVFPRWVGYYNLWVAVLFIPGGMATFFKHGAFAWNGLLAFWLAAVVFGTWFIVMSVMLRRAIREQAAEEAATAPVPAREAVVA
jgi:hypothetical protein